MKFRVYAKRLNRYLSEIELQTSEVSVDGKTDKKYPECYETTVPFRVNLLTGKIQIDQDNACSDETCCTPIEMFADDDDYIIEVVAENSNSDVKNED